MIISFGTYSAGTGAAGDAADTVNKKARPRKIAFFITQLLLGHFFEHLFSNSTINTGQKQDFPIHLNKKFSVIRESKVTCACTTMTVRNMERRTENFRASRAVRYFSSEL
jgi:hypothetical protein